MRSVEKRTRDIHKKLDRMATGGGWSVFASNIAWSRPERQGAYRSR